MSIIDIPNLVYVIVEGVSEISRAKPSNENAFANVFRKRIRFE